MQQNIDQIKQYQDIGDMLDKAGYYDEADDWDNALERLAKLHSSSFVKTASVKDKEDLEDQIFIDTIKIASRVEKKDPKLAHHMRQVVSENWLQKGVNWLGQQFQTNVSKPFSEGREQSTQQHQQDQKTQLQEQVLGAIGGVMQMVNRYSTYLEQTYPQLADIKNQIDNFLTNLSPKTIAQYNRDGYQALKLLDNDFDETISVFITQIENAFDKNQYQQAQQNVQDFKTYLNGLFQQAQEYAQQLKWNRGKQKTTTPTPTSGINTPNAQTEVPSAASGPVEVPAPVG